MMHETMNVKYTEIYFFRNSQNEFKEVFSQEDDLLFCNDVCCVTDAL
jgi:hypothetical protein